VIKSNQITCFRIKPSSSQVKSPHVIQSGFQSNRDLTITDMLITYYTNYQHPQTDFLPLTTVTIQHRLLHPLLLIIIN